MIDVYSNIQPNIVLCRKIEKLDFSDIRSEISDDSEILQVSARALPKGFEVRPHIHLPVKRRTVGTSEAWIVFAGSLEADIFDTDNNWNCSLSIRSGEAIIFYAGGHGLRNRSNKTLFLEIKNGPYFGQEKDKAWI